MLAKPCSQLVPGIYSRLGVYLLQSLAYPQRINETGIYSKKGRLLHKKIR